MILFRIYLCTFLSNPWNCTLRDISMGMLLKLRKRSRNANRLINENYFSKSSFSQKLKTTYRLPHDPGRSFFPSRSWKSLQVRQQTYEFTKFPLYSKHLTGTILLKKFTKQQVWYLPRKIKERRRLEVNKIHCHFLKVG